LTSGGAALAICFYIPRDFSSLSFNQMHQELLPGLSNNNAAIFFTEEMVKAGFKPFF
jgi:hypothetical protein